MLRTIAVLIACITTLVGASAHAETPDEHLFRGDMHYFDGDYGRAISEYKSFLLASVDDARRPRVELKIAWLHALDDQPEKAERILRRLSVEQQTEPEGWWARLYSAQVQLKGPNATRARSTYQQLIQDCEPIVAHSAEARGISRAECLELTTLARLGLAYFWTRQDDFDRAANQLNYLPQSAPQTADARKVAAYVSTLEIPSKSPLVAAALSIVPGAGHFYVGDWALGALALVLNGALIFGTVDSLVDQRYGQAAAFGLLELAVYSGTIYSAVTAAQRYNRRARRDVREGLTHDIEQISEDLPWSARFPITYPTPLRLRVDFQ